MTSHLQNPPVINNQGVFVNQINTPVTTTTNTIGYVQTTPIQSTPIPYTITAGPIGVSGPMGNIGAMGPVGISGFGTTVTFNGLFTSLEDMPGPFRHFKTIESIDDFMAETRCWIQCAISDLKKIRHKTEWDDVTKRGIVNTFGELNTTYVSCHVLLTNIHKVYKKLRFGGSIDDTTLLFIEQQSCAAFTGALYRLSKTKRPVPYKENQFYTIPAINFSGIQWNQNIQGHGMGNITVC